MSLKKLPIIAVIGASAKSHEEKSFVVGKWIAENNFHLLTGGGSGVMEAVSKAFCEVENRKGLNIGIIPKMNDPKRQKLYPNKWVEIPIFTQLTELKDSLFSRNHINVLSADFIIGLPGFVGTSDEVKIALENKKPMCLYLDSMDQIPSLPKNIKIYNNFDEIKEKVISYFQNKGVKN